MEPIGVSHAAQLFPLFQTELLSFIERPKSLVALEAQYRRWTPRISPDGTQLWLNWAARNCASGDYVGWFQATGFEDGGIGLAYVVFPAHWRRGYATEGCRWMMEHLLANYTPKSFFVEMDRRNVSSIALAKKLGFIRRENGSLTDEDRYEMPVMRAPPGIGDR